MKTKTIITLIMGIIGIILLANAYTIIGILLLMLTILRLNGYGLTQLQKSIIMILNNSNKNKRTNIYLSVSLNIAGILSSDKMNKLFKDLKDKKIINYDYESKFIKQIQENYKIKFKNDSEYTDEEAKKTYIWNKTEFNLKNDILWKNKEIEFSDIIQDIIFIPYTEEFMEEEPFFDQIGSGIRLRFLIVNGLIKLQVGSFDKKSSPKVIKDGGLAKYMDWYTLTTFPLMYLTQLFPSYYLNFSMHATESYARIGEESVDWLKDWENHTADLNRYNILYNLDDNDSFEDKHREIIQEFDKKSQEILEEEKFNNDNKPDDSGWYTPGWMENNDIEYSNDLISIRISDLNEYREKFLEYYASSYHEETP